jgi:hypothetical protein
VTTTAEKGRLFFALLKDRPREALDRLNNLLSVRLDSLNRDSAQYYSKPWNVVREELLEVIGVDLDTDPVGLDTADLERELLARRAELAGRIPFSKLHDGDFALGRCCFLVCRLLQPRVVVETGVAAGVTSAFILRALEENGQGRLLSIDLPPLAPEAEHWVGALIPEQLRGRWSLLPGSAKRLLPQLLNDVKVVDIFIHDSLHTAKHMSWELDLATERLPRPACVIADDVECNRAWQDWTARRDPSYSAVAEEEAKSGLFGVGLFLS